MRLIQQFKIKTKSFRGNLLYSKGLFYRLCRPAYKAVVFIYYLFFRRGYLSEKLTQLRYSRKIFQPSSYTAENRYPDLFNACANYFVNRLNLKLLSFGCSTGEEVLSLSRYLPNAEIIGVDINHTNLNECRKKFSMVSKFDFKHSLSNDFKQLNSFDAIFCLAVLQHTENRNPGMDMARKFKFSRFEEILIELDQKLNVGGLLFIDHTDFDFLNTSISMKYKPLAVANNQLERDRPLFSRDNVKIAEVSCLYRIFQKQDP